jgi:hypothetical protein
MGFLNDEGRDAEGGDEAASLPDLEEKEGKASPTTTKVDASAGPCTVF